jgi:hypothetical protein
VLVEIHQLYYSFLSRMHTVHIRRVQLLAFGFWLLFNAYSAAQLLQTAVNGTAGYACLATLYALFAVSALFAPTLVGWIGYMWLIPLSAVPYVIMVAVNMAPTLGSLMPACSAVGIAAATLWSAQSMYVAKCGINYARDAKIPLTNSTSLMNARFYAIFASSGGFSNIMASVIIMSVKDAIKTLFIYLSFVGTAAVCVMSIVPDPELDMSGSIVSLVPICCRARKVAAKSILQEDSVAQRQVDVEITVELPSAESRKPAEGPAPKLTQIPSVIYMFRFLATSPGMLYMTPMLFTSGLGMGVFNGLWMGQLVSAGIGVQYVGFVGAAYSFTSAVGAYLWGKLVQRPAFGRRWAFVGAFGFHMVFLVCSAMWSFAFVDSEEAKAPDDAVSFPLFIIMAMVYACGDSVWFSQLPATLQTFYSTGPESPCAMASIRLYTAIGFSVATLTSIALAGNAAPQFVFQAVCMLASGVSLWYMNKHVRPIDPQSTDPPESKLPNDEAVVDSTPGLQIQVQEVPVVPPKTTATGPVEEAIQMNMDVSAPQVDWQGDEEVWK